MPHETKKTAETAAPAPTVASKETVVRYAVAELLRGGREAILEHDGAEYHLRITAAGKLILTK